jgi:hypothetical protein
MKIIFSQCRKTYRKTYSERLAIKHNNLQLTTNNPLWPTAHCEKSTNPVKLDPKYKKYRCLSQIFYLNYKQITVRITG